MMERTSGTREDRAEYRGKASMPDVSLMQLVLRIGMDIFVTRGGGGLIWHQ